MINLFKHNIDKEAIDNCIGVLRSGWHTSGPVGDMVEELIAEYYGDGVEDVYYAALTNSCTSALIATAMAAGIKAGDKIITTPTTFVATSSSFMMLGATPVFVDIDESGLMDVSKVEQLIDEDVKGIWVVNLYGHMPDILKLSEISEKHGLFLLEDCAHAFDSKRDRYRPATHSNAACFSFYATKNTHSGEGGCVVSKNYDLIRAIKSIRRHGMSQIPVPGTLGNIGYDVSRLGFKGNMSDINASLLVSQIKNDHGVWKPDYYRIKRQTIADKYTTYFKDLQHVRSILPYKAVESSWYTYPILVDNRNSLRSALQENKIGHTVMYPSLETYSFFGSFDITCQNAYYFGNYQLSLPCHPSLTDCEQQKVIDIISEWDDKCIS